MIDALPVKIGPAFEKSSASTLGSILIWSMTLTPGPSAPLTVFISVALAESSGKSPLSVMLLPLRLIESGARDNFGAPGLFDGAFQLLGPAPDRGCSSVADCRYQQRYNHQANQPGKAATPRGARHDPKPTIRPPVLRAICSLPSRQRGYRLTRAHQSDGKREQNRPTATPWHASATWSPRRKTSAHATAARATSPSRRNMTALRTRRDRTRPVLGPVAASVGRYAKDRRRPARGGGAPSRDDQVPRLLTWAEMAGFAWC